MIYINPRTSRPRATDPAAGVLPDLSVNYAASTGSWRACATAARVFGLAALLSVAACSTTGRSSAGVAAATPDAAPRVTTDRFCSDAQAQVALTRVPTVNVVHTDYQAFVESKPQPRPLETQQYVWYEDGGGRRPKMVSCKMKTADHIRAEYGDDQSGGDVSCVSLVQRTAEAVIGSLTREERRRLRFDGGRAIVYEPDQLTTDGPTWLAPFPLLFVGEDGALHARTKAMKNDWFDPRLANAAPRFKGTRYCHLVAPEYMKRVLLGDVTP